MTGKYCGINKRAKKWEKLKKEGKSIHKAETNTNQKEELESIAKRWYELSDNLTLYIAK